MKPNKESCKNAFEIPQKEYSLHLMHNYKAVNKHLFINPFKPHKGPVVRGWIAESTGE